VRVAIGVLLVVAGLALMRGGGRLAERVGPEGTSATGQFHLERLFTSPRVALGCLVLIVAQIGGLVMAIAGAMLVVYALLT
jgi:hypothetical protein